MDMYVNNADYIMCQYAYYHLIHNMLCAIYKYNRKDKT
jgi:uncharacterized protein YcgL (UPF0745 family)